MIWMAQVTRDAFGGLDLDEDWEMGLGRDGLSMALLRYVPLFAFFYFSPSRLSIYFFFSMVIFADQIMKGNVLMRSRLERKCHTPKTYLQ